MISSDFKKVFEAKDGMLYEMKRAYLRTPHFYPEVYAQARKWVYEQAVHDVQFGTQGGSTINGKYYPSEIWFGTHCPDIEFMFRFTFSEIVYAL